MSGGIVHAAGGVLWRAGRSGGSGGREVAVVHRPRYDDWSLPKGKLDAGEHPLEGACREVLEETAARPVAGPYLGTVSYTARTKSGGAAPKIVNYWAMRAESEAVFHPNDEIDALTWLPLDDARSRLSYAHDEPVLERFAALPEFSAMILLLRHGHAGERDEWRGDDALRPLVSKGAAQAVAAARVLPWFGPRRIVSADRVRCVQTVEPLAAGLGIHVEVEAVFSEERHKKEPEAAARRLRELAVEGSGGAESDGTVAVVSSQGGVIPDVVSQLAAADGVRLESVESRKGSAWALFFRASALVAADFYDDLEHAPR